jgi:glycosyl hydrolase family 113
VRKAYKGQITYSSNWDNYTQVPFWNQLDLISMNSYWKLGRDKNASVGEIMDNWRQIQKDVLAFTQKQGKPLMFSEVGWCSLENAASEPWDYTRTDLSVDTALQKRLYEGFFRAWYGNPALGGFMIWNWEPGDGGPSDKGYTPENKPAEKVLREWMGKSWDGK